MGVEQFSQTVRGTGGTLATNTSGTVETDNYAHGGSVSDGAPTYPVSMNPAATIQELNIIEAGDVEAEITTTGGDTFTLRLYGGAGSFDKWEIDSVTFRDPRGTGAALVVGWAGE
jgi:hypothetical protein